MCSLISKSMQFLAICTAYKLSWISVSCRYLWNAGVDTDEMQFCLVHCPTSDSHGCTATAKETDPAPPSPQNYCTFLPMLPQSFHGHWGSQALPVQVLHPSVLLWKPWSPRTTTRWQNGRGNAFWEQKFTTKWKDVTLYDLNQTLL